MESNIKLLKTKNDLGNFLFSRKHIALYGGSFNPPHFGHIEAMELSLKYVDKILIFPHSYNVGRKDFLAPLNDRTVV